MKADKRIVRKLTAGLKSQQQHEAEVLERASAAGFQAPTGSSSRASTPSAAASAFW